MLSSYNTSEHESKRIKGKIEAAGGRAAVLAADVDDTAQCATLVHQAEELFGLVDILVGNAPASANRTKLLIRPMRNENG